RPSAPERAGLLRPDRSRSAVEDLATLAHREDVGPRAAPHAEQVVGSHRGRRPRAPRTGRVEDQAVLADREGVGRAAAPGLEEEPPGPPLPRTPPRPLEPEHDPAAPR